MPMNDIVRSTQCSGVTNQSNVKRIIVVGKAYTRALMDLCLLQR